MRSGYKAGSAKLLKADTPYTPRRLKNKKNRRYIRRLQLGQGVVPNRRLDKVWRPPTPGAQPHPIKLQAGLKKNIRPEGYGRPGDITNELTLRAGRSAWPGAQSRLRRTSREAISPRVGPLQTLHEQMLRTDRNAQPALRPQSGLKEPTSK